MSNIRISFFIFPVLLTFLLAQLLHAAAEINTPKPTISLSPANNSTPPKILLIHEQAPYATIKTSSLLPLLPDPLDQAWFDAINNNNLPCIKTLLVNKCNPDAQTIDTDAALFTATRTNNHTLIKTLVQYKASIDKEDRSGLRTPLITAITYGTEKTVKLLLLLKATVNYITSHTQETALSAAVHKGIPSFIQLLLKAGANANLSCSTYNSTALQLAKNRLSYYRLTSQQKQAYNTIIALLTPVTKQPKEHN